MILKLLIGTLAATSDSRRLVEIHVPEGGLSIGRKTTELKLEDPKISITHLYLFFRTDVGLRFIDLSSRNGTYLDGKRIDRGSLRVGCELRIGDTKLTVIKIQESETHPAQAVSNDARQVLAE